MKMNKPILVLIQSTDSPVKEHLDKGIWSRQEFTLRQYASAFNVLYYTNDVKKFQNIMPEGVTHCSAAITSSFFGFRHVLYYIFLFLSSFKWRKMNAVVRVIGVNVPIIPVLKFISGKYFVMSYQFDWAYGMKKDYTGIKPLVSSFVQRRVIGAADHLICTTRWLADIAKERYRKSNITIIPNYVDMEKFKPASAKKKQIVFAGRLHWSKGIDVLINAFRGFSKIHPEYKLIIMGTGEEEANLRKLAEGSNVVFTGGVSHNEVAKNFNESEIFVLPTVNMEGHPKALVEAMAAGCKCIASNVPGNNNVLIESNSSDFLFTSNDGAHLLDRLIYVLTNTPENQLSYARQNYDAKGCFRKEISILKAQA